MIQQNNDNTNNDTTDTADTNTSANRASSPNQPYIPQDSPKSDWYCSTNVQNGFEDPSPNQSHPEGNPDAGNILSWEDLDLPPKILRGIYNYGYESPSPIQKRAIYPIMQGRDVIAQAQSGTGKTAAFTIGVLTRLDFDSNLTQAIVISPTKELSVQTCDVMKSLSSVIADIRIQNVYEGPNNGMKSNNMFNRKNPHIICGCPGRIYDMLYRGQLSAGHVKTVIIDEADELLSHGFKDQVYNIFQHFNEDIQVLLFSATLPDHLSEITDKITRTPAVIKVKADMLTLQGISQFYVAVNDDGEKYETLKHIFGFISLSQCIIYCNSIRRVCDLYDAMSADDFPVCCIHSGMDKSDRERAFNDFRKGGARVMISSNVTARGIDIQQVSTVINFDIPTCVHTYLHRIGRSGRWGRKGVGINFVTRSDLYRMKDIEAHYHTQINEMPADLSVITK